MRRIGATQFLAKTAALPSIRVEPGPRGELESTTGMRETIMELVDSAVRRAIKHGRRLARIDIGTASLA